MSDIKRYFITPTGPSDACEEWEDKRGEWVRYADHEAEVKRLEARVRELEADPRMALHKDALLLAQRLVEARAKEHAVPPAQRDILQVLAKGFARAAATAPPGPMWLAALAGEGDENE